MKRPVSDGSDKDDGYDRGIPLWGIEHSTRQAADKVTKRFDSMLLLLLGNLHTPLFALPTQEQVLTTVNHQSAHSMCQRALRLLQYGGLCISTFHYMVSDDIQWCTLQRSRDRVDGMTEGLAVNCTRQHRCSEGPLHSH